MPLFNNPSLSIGRTKFFQKRKIEDVQEILDQFAGGIQGVQTAANTAKLTVDAINNNVEQANKKLGVVVTQSSTVLSNIEAFDKAVGMPQDTTSDSLFSKVNMLKEIAMPPLLFPESFPEKKIHQLWVCERTLHRIEQLVTDKLPNKAENNRELQKIINDALTTECKDILKDSPNLVKGIETIHSHFKGIDVSERYTRFYEIQKLRKEIIGHLATKTEEQQSS
jgi:hypothetical protein